MTLSGDRCKAHSQRRAKRKAATRQPPRRKSGNKGHRLTYTKVSSPEINRKTRAVRKAKPVTVTHADGRTEVRAPDSFGRSRKSRMRAAQVSVERDKAHARYVDAVKANRNGSSPTGRVDPKPALDAAAD